MSDFLVGYAAGKTVDAIVEKLRDFIEEHQTAKRDAAFRHLFAELAAADHVDDPVRYLEARLQSEDNKLATVDMLFEWYRYMMEAIDESARPYIAKLTVLALDGRVNNLVFRRTGRMLRDADGETLQQLTTVFRFVRETFDAQGLRPKAAVAHDGVGVSSKPGVLEVHFTPGVTPEKGTRDTDARLAIRALYKADLASERTYPKALDQSHLIRFRGPDGPALETLLRLFAGWDGT